MRVRAGSGVGPSRRNTKHRQLQRLQQVVPLQQVQQAQHRREPSPVARLSPLPLLLLPPMVLLGAAERKKARRQCTC